ncbi:MAG: hypothetical protein WAL61_09955 [Acidimicrobiales bacterium]
MGGRANPLQDAAAMGRASSTSLVDGALTSGGGAPCDAVALRAA